MLTIQITLPDEVGVIFDSISTKKGKSKEDLARRAVLTYVEDTEDYYLALEACEEGGSKHSLEEIKAELDARMAELDEKKYLGSRF